MAKVLIAGDFVPQQRIANAFNSGKFEEVWGNIPAVISDSDYALLNLECPLSDSNLKPIDKTGPNLKCSSIAVDAIKFAGFNGVTLANNHFRDYGDDGVLSTIGLLRKAEMDYVGGGTNLEEASKILRKEIGGYNVAFINMCENEWSIATDNHGGSNPIDSLSLFYQIHDAKKTSDYVIVILHGGKELYQLPTPRMKKLFHYIVDIGADAVINHHQHCYSGYEVYNGKPIFYGLGNFLFDKGLKAPKGWHDGYMVQLNLDEKIEFKIIPYKQCAEKAMIEILTDVSSFKKDIDSLNAIISDDQILQERYDSIVEANIPIVKGLVEPYWGRAVKGIIRKIGGPYLQNPKGYKLLLANLQCQTHFEIFITALQKIVNDKK